MKSHECPPAGQLCNTGYGSPMPKPQENAPISALLKGFGVIEHLSGGKTSLVDISRKMGLPKSSAYRVLATLVELDVVGRTANEEYYLTPKLFAYGAKALRVLELVPTALPGMNRLRDRTGETVHLAIRSGVSAVYLQKVESSYSLRMTSTIGYQAPLYSTSLGKCLLAWMDPAEASALIDTFDFRPTMPNTITDKASLLAHLAEVRRNGYACDNEENEANVICFGAPIFDHYRQIHAAVSVSMPMLRYEPEKRASLARAVQETGRDVSRLFGCENWPPDDAK